MPAQRTLVLMYHGIAATSAAQDPANNFVAPSAFAAQLDRLLERGFTAIDEATYLAGLDGGRLPRASVLLTFDDGFVSVLETAAPLLAARSMPAVCYVSAGLLGRGPVEDDLPHTRLLTGDEVRSLTDLGVAVGCHGWEHASMPGMSAELLRRSTVKAMGVLRDLTGSAPRTFAYPYGHHDGPAREAVRRAGFLCAFATYDGGGRHAVPRIDINSTDTPRTFDLKISRGYPFVRRALSRTPAVRRVAHRAVGYAERS